MPYVTETHRPSWARSSGDRLVCRVCGAVAWARGKARAHPRAMHVREVWREPRPPVATKARASMSGELGLTGEAGTLLDAALLVMTASQRHEIDFALQELRDAKERKDVDDHGRPGEGDGRDAAATNP